jgi:hypothetical protein
MSFGGLFVQAIGFGNNHVKHNGERFHYRHAHAAMIMIFEAKGCMAWCPKRLQDEDHTNISGSMDKKDNDVIEMPCTTSAENNWIYLNFQKLHEVYVPTNQVAGNRRLLQADMAESPMVAHAEILDSKQC